MNQRKRLAGRRAAPDILTKRPAKGEAFDDAFVERRLAAAFAHYSVDPSASYRLGMLAYALLVDFYPGFADPNELNRGGAPKKDDEDYRALCRHVESLEAAAREAGELPNRRELIRAHQRDIGKRFPVVGLGAKNIRTIEAAIRRGERAERVRLDQERFAGEYGRRALLAAAGIEPHNAPTLGRLVPKD